MKRILTLLCALLLVTNLSAQRSQRIAVFEFEPGANIKKEEVDGISSIFTTYFQPTGYTLVDRTEIDKILHEQGVQYQQITENQKTQLGKIHNISKMVFGTINIANGEYNVDVKVVDVTRSDVVATDGCQIPLKTSYRESIKRLATSLAKKVEALPISDNDVRERAGVEVVLDYLKVYPTELGEYSYEPTQVIKQINLQHKYDYDTWRIPTTEELDLLRNNGYIREETYITSSNRQQSGIVLLVTDATETYSEKQARLALEAQKASERKKTTTTTAAANPFTQSTEQPIDALKADIKNIHQQSELTMMADLDFALGSELVVGSPSFTIGRTYKERLFIGIGAGYYIINHGTEYDHYFCHRGYMYYDCPYSDDPYFNGDLSYISLYAHSRFYFKNIPIHLTKNFIGHPYLTLSLGSSSVLDCWCNAFYFNSQIGVDFPLYNKLAFYLQAGVETLTHHTVIYGENDCCKISTEVASNYGEVGLSIKLGLRF